jgi:hypothetical protein
MAIVTISRLTGSGGREIAIAAAHALNFQLIDRTTPLAEIASAHDVVILGSGSQFLFEQAPMSFHVQIVAPLAYRVARVMRLANVDRAAAEGIIEQRDRDKEMFLLTLYSKDWRDPSRYDLVLNIDHFSNEAAVKIIIDAARSKGIEAAVAALPVRMIELAHTIKLEQSRKFPDFAHPSEREFARVMDFYGVRWKYEPRTFPIEWDEQRTVVQAFTPDFYLPDFDLFIELTTMKQSLVTKKNRKIRRLRELYPDVNIKVLYERDYKSLVWKYGLPPAEQNRGK